jgi:hypothetical protein
MYNDKGMKDKILYHYIYIYIYIYVCVCVCKLLDL